MATKILRSGDSITQTMSTARPGDTFLLRGGDYVGRVDLTRPGTASALITLQNYEGEIARIIGSADGSPSNKESVNITQTATYNRVLGLEILGGYDGVIVEANYSGVGYCHIHDNAKHGIIVASCHHVNLQGNTIERNGVTHANPWQQHGIYLSDYFARGIWDIYVSGGVIRDHGGACVHVWNSTKRTQRVRISGVMMDRSPVPVVLANVDDAILSGCVVRQNGYPATTATRAALVWLEQSTKVVFEKANRMEWTQTPSAIPADLLYLANQDRKQVHLDGSNLWSLPAEFGTVTDAVLTKNLGLG